MPTKGLREIRAELREEELTELQAAIEAVREETGIWVRQPRAAGMLMEGHRGSFKRIIMKSLGKDG